MSFCAAPAARTAPASMRKLVLRLVGASLGRNWPSSKAGRRRRLRMGRVLGVGRPTHGVEFPFAPPKGNPQKTPRYKGKTYGTPREATLYNGENQRGKPRATHHQWQATKGNYHLQKGRCLVTIMATISGSSVWRANGSQPRMC